MKILEVFKKSIVAWLWFSLTVVIVWFTYATISNVSTWEALTSAKWNTLVAEVNLNSNKKSIDILSSPVTAASRWNWQSWVGNTVLDLNSVWWITVPVGATHAIVYANCTAYSSANTTFWVNINSIWLCSQNWHASGNKWDNSMWIFELDWTNITYSFTKGNTTWSTSFSVAWFVIQ